MVELFRTDEQSHQRILVRVGMIGVVVVLMAAGVLAGVSALSGKPVDTISVSISVPYVGQGVTRGTPIIMHGSQVGRVTAISSRTDGGVRMVADLDSRSTAGLTDGMEVDFRPSNYFGVTGVNIMARQGGQLLRDGSDVTLTPRGNFALQALLYRVGELSDQVVNQRLVGIVERVTRYTDGLTPLLETLIKVSTSVTNVQTVTSAQLLRNATGITVALPGFFDALIGTGNQFLYTKIGLGFDAEKDKAANPYISTYDDQMMQQYDYARNLLATNPDEFVFGRFKEWLVGAESDLFTKVGDLLSSHIYDLFPAVQALRMITDVVPSLVPAQDISNTLRQLRERLERMYAGSGEQRALQVRIVIDSLPAIAGPLELALGAAG